MNNTAAAAFQKRVASLALAVSQQEGFALAGGQALIAHGIVSRPTEDIDLFTDADIGVRRATEAVIAALLASGFEVERVADVDDLGEIFDGFGDEMAELEIETAGMSSDFNSLGSTDIVPRWSWT